MQLRNFHALRSQPPDSIGQIRQITRRDVGSIAQVQHPFNDLLRLPLLQVLDAVQRDRIQECRQGFAGLAGIGLRECGQQGLVDRIRNSGLILDIHVLGKKCCRVIDRAYQRMKFVFALMKLDNQRFHA